LLRSARGRCLRSAPGLPIGSAPWVTTAGDPVRGTLTGPQLLICSMSEGDCRCLRLVPGCRPAQCPNWTPVVSGAGPGLSASSMSKLDTGGIWGWSRAVDPLDVQAGHRWYLGLVPGCRPARCPSWTPVVSGAGPGLSTRSMSKLGTGGICGRCQAVGHIKSA